MQDIRKHPQGRTAKYFHKREKPKGLSTGKGKTCSSVFSYGDVKICGISHYRELHSKQFDSEKIAGNDYKI